MTDANFSITAPVLVAGESFLVKYKLSSDSLFTQLTPNPTGQDFTIPNLADGCYDFSIQKVKADGSVCPNARTGTFCVGASACCTPTLTSAQSVPAGSDNTLNIVFSMGSCTPPPDSVRVYYRVKGSGTAFINGGDFPSSPAVVNDGTTNPLGTQYEGYIVGVCGVSESVAQEPFETNCEPPVSVLVSVIDQTVKVDLPSPGNWDIRIVNAGSACTDTAIETASISGNTWTSGTLPVGTYKACARRNCSATQSSWVSSTNFSIESAGGDATEIIVEVGPDEPSLCGGGSIAEIVYMDAPALGPGVHLFYDIGLSSPFVGWPYIKDPGGVIYAVDSGTGTVTGPTGNTC